MSEAAFLQRNIVRVLREVAEGLSPREIHKRVHFLWRTPPEQSVRDALRTLREKGCVICSGRTRDRKCKATTVRPVKMTGFSPGSSIGLAIGSEQFRQEAYRTCGVVPTPTLSPGRGSALERHWPMVFGQHPAEEDE